MYKQQSIFPLLFVIDFLSTFQVKLQKKVQITINQTVKDKNFGKNIAPSVRSRGLKQMASSFQDRSLWIIVRLIIQYSLLQQKIMLLLNLDQFHKFCRNSPYSLSQNKNQKNFLSLMQNNSRMKTFYKVK
ncbi:unnamed protein product [Paramecium pentaurelia]|uniref:Uncharacterized protein n=1 Tax=Paramecium pentaurelia TaxID=43138 RepID=A0A8S1XWZ3_9CILI|nr:unnamed protein product [Paramecium pentaurelia]